MNIGDKMRYYRTQQHMTQEKLAAELCISPQAVSKWERSESLPDVLLLARLADALQVTCDALLAEPGWSEENEIDTAIRQAEELSEENHAEYRQRTALLEKALEQHPRSIRLMLALADTYSKGADYPDFREKDYLKRAVNLNEYAAAHTADPKEKYRINTMLCYMYRSLGEYGRIRELAETMPELWQTRPALIHHAMPGEEQYESICDFISELLDTAECYFGLLPNPEADGEPETLFRRLHKIADSRCRDTADRCV